jgi:hypothetical protein
MNHVKRPHYPKNPNFLDEALIFVRKYVARHDCTPSEAIEDHGLIPPEAKEWIMHELHFAPKPLTKAELLAITRGAVETCIEYSLSAGPAVEDLYQAIAIAEEPIDPALAERVRTLFHDVTETGNAHERARGGQ